MPLPPAKRVRLLALPALVAAFALAAGCSPPQSGPAGSGKAVFPLPKHMSGYADDWGAPRPQGTHEGADLYAPRGTPVRSITAGTVVQADETTDSGWNTLGGYTVNVRVASDAGPVERGDALYYAHLRGPSPLEPGDAVEAGDKLGEVGATGGGPPGTQNAGPPHLHLGWYVPPPREQAKSGAKNPYPLLERLRESGGSFTARPEKASL